mmetsp:Transcript_7376/g.18516  ORF Transcript_7376/g.18516 Transcript_7376/m.18516 type:complete len:266 (+) Transcript_7376:102-899(+)
MMAELPAAEMPTMMAKEITREYADILRVGRLWVNGAWVTWQTGGSMDLQLQRFCAALFASLRRLPESASFREPMMQRCAYWICKTLSINYILMEVLHAIGQRVGVLCTIEGSQDSTGADYSIELLPGPALRAAIVWTARDNIVHRDPHTAERRVKATLNRMDTEFPLPPELGFAPSYTINIEFRRSLASQILSTMACQDACTDKQGPSQTNIVVSPLAPLRSSSEEAADRTLQVCCPTAFDLLGSWLPWFQGQRTGSSSPRCEKG